MAKGKGSANKPSKAPAPKGKPAKAAAAKPPEPELKGKPAAKAAAKPETPSEMEAAAKPAGDTVQVVELVNGADGVWKKLSNGKRVDLTTKEWRQELSRVFTRAPAP